MVGTVGVDSLLLTSMSSFTTNDSNVILGISGGGGSDVVGLTPAPTQPLTAPPSAVVADSKVILNLAAYAECYVTRMVGSRERHSVKQGISTRKKPKS